MGRKNKLTLRKEDRHAVWKTAVRQLFNLFVAAVCLLTLQLALAVQVIELGLEADRSGVYWISAEEVLFLGPTGEFATSGKRVNRVSTWNIRTKEVKRFETGDGGLCYDDGRIAYWERDFSPSREWMNIGRFGEELKRIQRTSRFDPMTCLPYDELPSLPEWTKERWIMRLRPEHGFVDLGPHSEMKNTPIRLFRPGSETSVELPIGRREFVQARVRYFPFRGAYFFESEYFVSNPRHPDGGSNLWPWPQGLARPAWWLYPDGRVEEITIPYAIWMRREIIPTKPGLLARDSTFFTITGKKPFDGIYLIDGKGGGSRLIRGVFEANAVSADGCRFAITRQPEPGVRRPDYWTVTVLDFCQGD